MERKGWIKLHRKIMDNPVFQDPYLFKLWMYCLLKASHRERKQLVGKEVVILKEGQFIWGRNEAANELNHGTKPSERKSSSTWERYLKTLEQLEMLNRETNNKYTIVNIVKWRNYQDYDDESEQQSEQQSFRGSTTPIGAQPLKSEQRVNRVEQRHDNVFDENKNNNEQQVNNERTASEQQVNTNKNVKNVKNIEEEEERAREENPFKLFEENICPLSPLNIESLNQWCDDLGDDLVIAAIKLATKYNARSLAYVEDIFLEWYKNGIKTVDQARSYVSNKNKKNNTVPFRRKTKSNAESQYDDYDYGF